MSYVAIYLLGSAVALAVMRDRWPARIGTALVWPLGPMALVALIPVLLVAAAILWPVRVLGGAALAAAVVYFTGC